MSRKFLRLMLLLPLLINVFAIQVKAEEMPNIFGEFGVSIDAQSGEIIYDKNAKIQSYPASMTKVMTAMLLEENLADDELLTVSKNASIQECSCFVFEEGEKVSKEDALYILMMVSANDMAVAIAENVSGSVEEFSKLMNKKAKEIGALDTHFVSPNGLHDPEHKTTSYDMALITREAIKNDRILKAMGTTNKVIKTDKQEKTIENHSKMHTNPTTIGGKTGFTTPAGNTLVTIDKIDEKTVISVVMKSNLNNLYSDIKTISDYSLSQIESETLINKDTWTTAVNHDGKKLTLVPEKNLNVVKVKNSKEKYETKIVTNNEVFNEGVDIKKGQEIGKIELLKNKVKVDEVKLIAQSNFTVKPLVEVSEETKYTRIIKIAISLLVPFMCYAGFLILYNKKNKKPA